MKREESGQALPLLMIVTILVMGIMVVLVAVSNRLAIDAQAQTAADAAALAGAAQDESAARAVAKANQSELIDFRVVGDDTVVQVQKGEATKSARARRDGLGSAGSGR